MESEQHTVSHGDTAAPPAPPALPALPAPPAPPAPAAREQRGRQQHHLPSQQISGGEHDDGVECNDPIPERALEAKELGDTVAPRVHADRVGHAGTPVGVVDVALALMFKLQSLFLAV